MKVLRIIVQVIFLYLLSLLGEYLQQLFHLPIPGSIVGLLILFVLLLCKIVPIKWIENGATAILAYLPLFFIPATAGIVNHMDIFSGRGLLLIVILIVSSVLTMVVAAHFSHWLALWSKKSKREKGNES